MLFDNTPAMLIFFFFFFNWSRLRLDCPARSLKLGLDICVIVYTRHHSFFFFFLLFFWAGVDCTFLPLIMLSQRFKWNTIFGVKDTLKSLCQRARKFQQISRARPSKQVHRTIPPLFKAKAILVTCFFNWPSMKSTSSRSRSHQTEIIISLKRWSFLQRYKWL